MSDSPGHAPSNRINIVKGAPPTGSVQRSSSAPLVTSSVPKTVPLLDQITAKIKKPLSELPASTDLPRMVQRISVTNYENQVVFNPLETSKNLDPKPSSLELLAQLFEALQTTISHQDEPKDISGRCALSMPSYFVPTLSLNLNL